MGDSTQSERYHPFFPEIEWTLPAMLFNAGHENRRHDRPYEFNGMRRGGEELAIFQYTLSGEGELDFAGERRRLFPGDAMLLVIPEDHCYRLPKRSGNWEYYYLSVNGAEAVRLFREFRQRHGAVLRFPPDAEVVRCLERILLQLRRREVADPPTASRLAYDFVTTLLQSSSLYGAADRDKLLPRVNRYCLARLDHPVTVADLAREANLSYWHFSHRFKQECGESPYDYILRLKFGYAARLLRESGDSVKTVAMACGFNDPSNFCKVFRRIHGKTPEQFRRQ